MNSTLDYIKVLGHDLKTRSAGLTAFECIFYIALFIATLFGNALTLWIILSNTKLRTISTNVLIATLAASDFSMGFFSMHFLVVVLITSHWPFGYMLCQYQGYVAIVLAAASTQTLTWTALNRYYRVCRSSQFNYFFTVERTKMVVVQIWVTSLLAPLPYVLDGHEFVFNPGKFFCYLRIDVSWFTALLVTLYVGFPSVIISFCYYKVFQLVHQHNKNISNRRSQLSLSVEEIRTTNILFVIVVVFMMCWTPILFIDIIDTVNGRLSLPRAAYTAYTFLATISYAINPLIYGIMNPTLKGQYLAILTCTWLRRERYSIRNRADQAIEVLPYEPYTIENSSL